MYYKSEKMKINRSLPGFGGLVGKGREVFNKEINKLYVMEVQAERCNSRDM